MSEKGKKKSTTGKKKGKTSSRSGSSSPRSPKKSSRSASPKSMTEKSVLPTLPTEPYIALPAKLPAMCPMHSKPFTLYSYSREQLLCADCVAAAPGMHHPTVSVDEAFRFKLGQVYNVLNNYMYGRKTRLEQLLREVESRIDEVKAVKQVIERDMRSEFASMNERLNSCSGYKEASLEHSLSSLQSDLDRIAHIIQTMDSSASDQVDFLRRHRDLRDMCEMALAKPVRTDIDVDPYDFPKELSETRGVVEEFAGLQALSDLKSEAIFSLLQGYATPEPLDKEAEDELREWMKLADRYVAELSQLKLVCELCGGEMDELTVNSACQRNVRDGKHFFARPKDLPKAPLRPMTDPEPLLPPPPPEPTDPFSLIRMVLRERRLDLDQLLRSRDLLNTGVLDPTEFHQMLCGRLGVPSAIAGELTQRYDVNRSGRIQYPLFLKDVMEPEYQVTDKLRRVISKLSDELADLDYRGYGTLSLDRFREVLRRNGFSFSEIQLALQLAGAGEGAEVRYRSFVERVKVGQ